LTANITVSSADVNAAISGNLVVVLYSDNSGSPDVLLARSAVVAVSAPGWVNVTMPATTLNAGTSYWYGAVSDNDMISTFDNPSAEPAMYYEASWTAGDVNLPPSGSTWSPYSASNQVYLNGGCTP
jgi:hypothetical protein